MKKLLSLVAFCIVLLLCAGVGIWAYVGNVSEATLDGEWWAYTDETGRHYYAFEDGKAYYYSDANGAMITPYEFVKDGHNKATIIMGGNTIQMSFDKDNVVLDSSDGQGVKMERNIDQDEETMVEFMKVSYMS